MSDVFTKIKHRYILLGAFAPELAFQCSIVLFTVCILVQPWVSAYEIVCTVVYSNGGPGVVVHSSG